MGRKNQIWKWKYENLYTRVKTDVCYYCNSQRDELTQDHAFPLSELRKACGNIAVLPWDVPEEMMLLVDACRPCNETLSNIVFHTMEERKRYARSWRHEYIARHTQKREND